MEYISINYFEKAIGRMAAAILRIHYRGILTASQATIFRANHMVGILAQRAIRMPQLLYIAGRAYYIFRRREIRICLRLSY